jgi:hypothetical protein
MKIQYDGYGYGGGAGHQNNDRRILVYASTICGELSKAGSNGTITTATSIKLSALGSSMLR